jgi:hypothetical protein
MTKEGHSAKYVPKVEQYSAGHIFKTIANASAESAKVDEWS